jgi:hypothetical protein
VPKLKISLPRPAEGSAPAGVKPPPIPKVKRGPNKLLLIGGAVAAVFILGGVYFVWLKPEPPPPPPPPRMAAKPKPVATPGASGATPSAAPAAGGAAATPAVSTAGKMVEKAQGTAGARTAAVDNSDGLLEKRGPADAAEKTAKSAPPPEETIAASKTIAPGISATNTNVMVAPEASPAFRAWAANAKVGGVFPGRVRAVINSRTVDGGQTIDDALGIVFDSVDTSRKVLIFRDKSGATVSIKY